MGCNVDAVLMSAGRIGWRSVVDSLSDTRAHGVVWAYGLPMYTYFSLGPGTGCIKYQSSVVDLGLRPGKGIFLILQSPLLGLSLVTRHIFFWSQICGGSAIPDACFCFFYAVLFFSTAPTQVLQTWDEGTNLALFTEVVPGSWWIQDLFLRSFSPIFVSSTFQQMHAVPAMLPATLLLFQSCYEHCYCCSCPPFACPPFHLVCFCKPMYPFCPLILSVCTLFSYYMLKVPQGWKWPTFGQVIRDEAVYFIL